MNKLIYYIVLFATLLWTACTQDDERRFLPVEAPISFSVPGYPLWEGLTRTTQNPDGSVQWTKGDSLFVSVRWQMYGDQVDNLYVLCYDGNDWVPEQTYHWPAGDKYTSGEFIATYWGADGRTDTKNVDILTSRIYVLRGEQVQFPSFKHEATRFILTNFPADRDLWFFRHDGEWNVDAFVARLKGGADTVYLRIGDEIRTPVFAFALALPGVMPDYPSYQLYGGESWGGSPQGKTFLFDFNQAGG